MRLAISRILAWISSSVSSTSPSSAVSPNTARLLFRQLARSLPPPELWPRIRCGRGEAHRDRGEGHPERGRRLRGQPVPVVDTEAGDPGDPAGAGQHRHPVPLGPGDLGVDEEVLELALAGGAEGPV